MKGTIAIIGNAGIGLTEIHAQHPQAEQRQCTDNPKIVKVFVMRPEIESAQMFMPPNPRPWERRKKGQKR